VVVKSLWIAGPSQSGKTSYLVQQFADWVKQGTTEATSQKITTTEVFRPGVLVLGPTGDRRLQLADQIAIHDRDHYPVNSTTPLGFFQHEVILFWPLLVSRLNLKPQFPVRLRPETEQELATRLWRSQLDRGQLRWPGVGEYRLVRRTLDLMQLAAVSGTPIEEIPAMLEVGAVAEEFDDLWACMGELLLRWRQWCLDRGLLTYSIVAELYWRYLLDDETYQNHLIDRYQGIFADDVDEYPSIARDLFEVLLDRGVKGAFTYNIDGQVRLGLGADPNYLAGLGDRPDLATITLDNSLLKGGTGSDRSSFRPPSPPNLGGTRIQSSPNNLNIYSLSSPLLKGGQGGSENSPLLKGGQGGSENSPLLKGGQGGSENSPLLKGGQGGSENSPLFKGGQGGSENSPLFKGGKGGSENSPLLKGGKGGSSLRPYLQNWISTVTNPENYQGYLDPEEVRGQLFSLQTVSRAELLTETAQKIADEIKNSAIAPEEIALIAPGLDEIARYTIIQTLTRLGVPVNSLNDQRRLINSPIIRALLTLLALVYPGLGRLVDRDAIAELLQMFSQEAIVPSMAIESHQISNQIESSAAVPQPPFPIDYQIDPVRAGLLADYCYAPDPISPQLLPATTFARWDRLGYRATKTYQEIVDWIEKMRADRETIAPTPMHLFDQAIQQFFSPVNHLPRDQVSALRELMETVTHYWEVDQRLQIQGETGNAPDYVTVGEFIQLLRQGTVTANPFPRSPISFASRGVTLANIFQYRSAKLFHRWHFWLDAGSPLLSSGGAATLFGSQLFLRDWSGRPWTVADEEQANQERLTRILNDLLSRVGDRLYLCHSQLSTSGQEQTGPLLSWINGAIEV
jgi:hypothetical protein